ncbi:sodium:proton exchanger (plasmid) [Pseudonocardia sp. EC080610-09]|uniref:cation:proton antiporter n=1 Tax=Pseudonocardia sp. EC080610-09 TaxID=1688404 RepID=UPI000705A8F1|nr:cation:proton antiporter [Pseudonocardia sp. EC080610-09]ALL79934.1 sodium:proton exchanger [Pseudonocardia sp. EC080610-09]
MAIAPPLPASVLLHFLVAVVVLLAVARTLGALSVQFGLPSIVGELFTGVLLGPSLLGWIAPDVASWILPSAPEQMHLLDAVAQLGLLLLVGLTGTHIDMTTVRRQGRTVAIVSLSGLLIPLGLGIALGFGLVSVLGGASLTGPLVFSLFLGVAMCVTAIPVIAKTLTDMRLLHRNIGQLTLSAGMIDDTVGWLLLSLVSAAATTGIALGHIGLSVIVMIGFVLVAALVGRPVLRWVTARTTRSDSPGPTLGVAVIAIVGCAAATHAAHLEAIFGAFVAGIVLATTGTAVQKRLAPLRTVTLSVLAPLFLATAGLRMDLTALTELPVLGAAMLVLVVAIAGKFAGAYLAARLCRLSRWEGLALGAGMNSRGVVEVIIALTGLRLGVLSTAGYTVIVLVALVTSLMAPPLLRFAMNHVEQDETERLRALEHAVWAGAAKHTGSPG